MNTEHTVSLLDHLQTQGYELHDEPRRTLIADLAVSGIGTVRVVIHPNDGDRASVYLFDARMVCEWDAKFSPGTPDAVILATIEAAEWQLADKRGGPVTPAQADSA